MLNAYSGSRTGASSVGHFRVPKNLTFKARLSAKPLRWKRFFIMMQIKLIFTTKVSHLASFWKWDFLEYYLRLGIHSDTITRSRYPISFRWPADWFVWRLQYVTFNVLFREGFGLGKIWLLLGIFIAERWWVKLLLDYDLSYKSKFLVRGWFFIRLKAENERSIKPTGRRCFVHCVYWNLLRTKSSFLGIVRFFMVLQWN